MLPSFLLGMEDFSGLYYFNVREQFSQIILLI